MSHPRSASYDAVVIGGGHNGLVAAAYLARAGRRCVVLERRDAVGGAAVSERPFAGVHTLTVFGLHMPARLFAGDEQRAREQALEATLRSLNAVLDEPIEDCLLRAPGGEPCIEVRTPPDLERELRLPGGHIFHCDLAWPFAEDPADVGGWGVETGDPAILLCGAGARRGGGVSGIPGRNAAMAALAAMHEP